MTEVVLEEFDFIGSRNDTGAPMNNSQPSNNNSVSLDGNDDIDEDFHLLADDDDVPF